jgi:hypothetical protein
MMILQIKKNDEIDNKIVENVNEPNDLSLQRRDR